MASPTRGGIRPRPRRALLVGAALALASLAVTASALLGVDVYLHHRYAESVGVNVRGYRGLVAGAKRPGERRVVVLGGSTVFGYGVRTTEAFPALLERRLESRLGQEAVSVINLGYPKEGAWSFRATLEDYARLRYDVAILYEGYNDLRKAHRRVFRHDSPIFRLTGYFPLLPLVLAEKARAIRYGGDLAERYNVEDPVFRPDVADRTSAAALAAAAGVVRSLEAVLGPLSPDGAKPALAAQPGCRDRWRAYCAAMEDAVRAGFAHGARVLVVTQPYVADVHVEQQSDMVQHLHETFADERRLFLVDLGRAVDLRDRTVAFDGMHLTPQGNAVIAAALVEPVLAAMPAP